MKKKLSIFFGFFIALTAVFAVGFSPRINSLVASAAQVSITYNTKGGTIVSAGDSQTDESGHVSNFASAKLDGYVFLGWAVSDEAESLVDSTTEFTTDTTLYARWSPKSYVYTITQNGDTTLTIESESVSGKAYTLSTDATSLNDAVRLIELDNNSSTPSTLNFTNYVLHESESIALTESATISGTLSSTNELPIFNIIPAKSNQVFTFKNISLTNNNHDKLINIASETTYAASIKIDSAEFNTTKADSVALDIPNIEGTTLTLAGTISHTSTYLFKYVENMTFNLNDQTLEVSSPLKIGVDYVHDNAFLSTEVYDLNYDKIQPVALNSLYSVISSLSGKTFILNTSINVDYDLNSGAFADGYTTPTIYYKNTSSITLPTAEKVSKQYSHFDGWFGKITLSAEEMTTLGVDSSVWYFNTTALETCLSEELTLANIIKYSKTSLEDFSIDTSIKTYLYSSPQTTANAWLDLFLDVNKKPTLIAKWNAIKYTLSFVTNGGTAVDDIVKAHGEAISSPATTKIGYSFDAWFVDEQLNTEFEFTTMPAVNLTLYAKWTINQYTVTFVHNNGDADSTITKDYQAEIVFPNISLEGHGELVWCTDEDLTTPITSTTIPADDITLYAKWTKLKYLIYLNFSGQKPGETIATLYGEVPTAPADPEATGYTFIGWYTTQTFTTEFDFTTPTPAQNRTAFARWAVKQYELTFVFNNGNRDQTSTKAYGSQIYMPQAPNRKGYVFEGWFDQTLQTQFMAGQTMPANDLTLYAKWKEKTTIVLNLEKQSVEVDGHGYFDTNSSLSGFIIEYKVGEEWQTEVPNEIGVYDVRIYRAEDANYAEYSKIIEDAFEVKQKTLDISWLPITLIIIFIIEICMVIVIKLLRKKKRTQAITLSTIVLPFGIISKSQAILSLVTAALALFGFIYMVVELVKLHRTVPQEDKPNDKYDNRALLEKRGDKSENATISSNVDALLKREGLYTEEFSKDDAYKIEDDIISRADDAYTGKRRFEEDDDE